MHNTIRALQLKILDMQPVVDAAIELFEGCEEEIYCVVVGEAAVYSPEELFKAIREYKDG